jgi:hypothetical protein
MSNQQHTTVRCRASLSCMAEPPETYSVESCRFYNLSVIHQKRPYPTLSFSEKPEQLLIADEASMDGEVLHLAAAFILWTSAGCAAPHTTHLSSAVWRGCFADACGTGHGQSFIPRFLCGARVRLPAENGHVAEPLCADHLCAIIGAAVLSLLLYQQRNEAERRLRLDKQIAVCFQNGESQIQKFISHSITALQQTSPTCGALAKAAHVPLRPIRTPTKSL